MFGSKRSHVLVPRGSVRRGEGRALVSPAPDPGVIQCSPEVEDTLFADEGVL